MKDLEAIWPIYLESFPANERRNHSKQKQLMNNPLYHLQVIEAGNDLVGFIAFWQLDDFVYIDHFAIKKEYRGKGYGSKTLAQFIQDQDKKIILEVERPQTVVAKRRITFYQKWGFNLNSYDYYQPAYDYYTSPVPLYLMSLPQALTPAEFEAIKNKLYLIVYEQ